MWSHDHFPYNYNLGRALFLQPTTAIGGRRCARLYWPLQFEETAGRRWIARKLDFHNYLLFDFSPLTGSRIINLASVVIHPDYRTQSELYSDIAVGKLSETLVFSEFIQPACLWTGAAEQSLIVGRNGVIVGWGLDESGMQTAEPKRVEVPIVSDQKCLRSHDGFGKITSDRTFCAGWRNGSEGPCAGDSGSGLMLNQDGKWFLRGLVSVSLKDSTTGSCDLHEFVVFTDVASFVSWITTLL